MGASLSRLERARFDPLGESVSNPEFFRRLSAAMGLTEPSLFDDDLTILRDILVNVDLDELRAQHHVRVPYPEDGRPFGAGEFATTSGRVEFVSERLEAMGQPRLPDFVAPQEGPGGPLHDRFLLQLMTSKRHLRFLILATATWTPMAEPKTARSLRSMNTMLSHVPQRGRPSACLQ